MYSQQTQGHRGTDMFNLIIENNHLREQAHTLNQRIARLEEENQMLRVGIAHPPPPPPPPQSQVYATASDNALALPDVIESLAIMRDHFHRQGTLRQCSTPGCNKQAFDVVCFRLGHMAWCGTHNRIITRTYTSCSIKAEERGDCVPVFWEQRHDWQEIVESAYRESKIGRKGVAPEHLQALLFSPVYYP